MRTAIRDAGLRATSRRLAVLAVLGAADRPMSHGEVVDRMGAAGDVRTTIYRNLIDLARAGLVHRADNGDHVWRFELARGKPHARAHPHFVCTSCGAIICLATIEVVLDRVRAPRAIKNGEFEIQVRGNCDACDVARSTSP